MKIKEKASGAQYLNKPFQTGFKQKTRHPAKKEEAICTLILSQKICANCCKMLGKLNIIIHVDTGTR